MSTEGKALIVPGTTEKQGERDTVFVLKELTL